MKRFSVVLLLLFLTGCATTHTTTSLDQDAPVVVHEDIYVERAIAGEPEDTTVDDDVDDTDYNEIKPLSPQAADTAKKIVGGGLIIILNLVDVFLSTGAVW